MKIEKKIKLKKNKIKKKSKSKFTNLQLQKMTILRFSRNFHVFSIFRIFEDTL